MRQTTHLLHSTQKCIALWVRPHRHSFRQSCVSQLPVHSSSMCNSIIDIAIYSKTTEAKHSTLETEIMQMYHKSSNKVIGTNGRLSLFIHRKAFNQSQLVLFSCMATQKYSPFCQNVPYITQEKTLSGLFFDLSISPQ